jgi:hypothetical protein
MLADHQRRTTMTPNGTLRPGQPQPQPHQLQPGHQMMHHPGYPAHVQQIQMQQGHPHPIQHQQHQMQLQHQHNLAAQQQQAEAQARAQAAQQQAQAQAQAHAQQQQQHQLQHQAQMQAHAQRQAQQAQAQPQPPQHAMSMTDIQMQQHQQQLAANGMRMNPPTPGSRTASGAWYVPSSWSRENVADGFRPNGQYEPTVDGPRGNSPPDRKRMRRNSGSAAPSPYPNSQPTPAYSTPGPTDPQVSLFSSFPSRTMTHRL